MVPGAMALLSGWNSFLKSEVLARMRKKQEEERMRMVEPLTPPENKAGNA
jgi:hypothetical protein